MGRMIELESGVAFGVDEIKRIVVNEVIGNKWKVFFYRSGGEQMYETVEMATEGEAMEYYRSVMKELNGKGVGP